MKYTLMLFVALLFCSLSQAQGGVRPRPGGVGSWRFLGKVEAGHSIDHDVIYVKGPYDYFRRLKFKVTDAGLNMHRMIVRFDDGGRPEEIAIRQNIPRGGESRVIDLRGGARKLKSIEFWYDSKGLFNGRADVSLFGQK